MKIKSATRTWMGIAVLTAFCLIGLALVLPGILRVRSSTRSSFALDEKSMARLEAQAAGGDMAASLRLARFWLFNRSDARRARAAFERASALGSSEARAWLSQSEPDLPFQAPKPISVAFGLRLPEPREPCPAEQRISP